METGEADRLAPRKGGHGGDGACRVEERAGRRRAALEIFWGECRLAAAGRPRALSHSGGKASRFRAVSTLCARAASRSQAAFAPKYFEGSTPAASSFFNTSCTLSTVPAFSRCQ